MKRDRPSSSSTSESLKKRAKLTTKCDVSMDMLESIYGLRFPDEIYHMYKIARSIRKVGVWESVVSLFLPKNSPARPRIKNCIVHTRLNYSKTA